MMRFFSKTLVLLAEGVAFCIGLAIVAMVLLVGRLMYGPLTTTALTPWLEAWLSQPQLGLHAELGDTLLRWDKENRTITLSLNNVAFKDNAGIAVAEVPEFVLLLNPLGYLDLTHSPWQLRMRHLALTYARDSVGNAQFFPVPTQVLPSPAAAFSLEGVRARLQHFFHAPHLTPRLYGFSLNLFADITVEDSTITLSDQGQPSHVTLYIPALTLKRIHNDYIGNATLTLQHDADKALLGFSFSAHAHDARFQSLMTFTQLNPGLLAAYLPFLQGFDLIKAPLGGSIAMVFDETLQLDEARLLLHVDAGTLTLPGVYPAPLGFKSGEMAARYVGASKTLSVDLLRFNFDQMVLHGTATLGLAQSPYHAELALNTDKMPVAAAMAYWPAGMASNARQWVVDNVAGGTVLGAAVQASLALPTHGLDQSRLLHLAADIQVANTHVNYWPPLPPAENTEATLHLTDSVMDAVVKGGTVAGVAIMPGAHIQISGLDADTQTLAMEALVKGSAKTIAQLLDREPLGYARKLQLNPDGVGGQVEGSLRLRFPLLKTLRLADIAINAQAHVTDAAAANIGGRVNVTDGTLEVRADKKALTLEGQARLNGVKGVVRWDEHFATAEPNSLLSDASFKTTATLQDLSAFGIILPLHSDAMPLNVHYQRFNARTQLEATADAGGAAVEIPALYYTKPAGDAATLQASFAWEGAQPIRLTQLSLQGKNLMVRGNGVFDNTHHLLQLTLDPFQLGLTNATVHYSHAAMAEAPVLQVQGEALDYRGAFAPAAKPATKPEFQQAPVPAATESPLQLAVDVTKLYTGKNTGLDNLHFKGTRDGQGWLLLEAAANAQGTPLHVSLTSQAGRSVFAATTPDLGRVLRALAITDGITGGALQVEGKSEVGDLHRTLVGHITLAHYVVKNLPILASLLSAISPDGLAEMLTGQGLNFTTLHGDYIWSRQVGVLTRAHTSVGSLGLTCAGKIDLGQGILDLEGQVIPAYFVSRFLSAIPLLGDVLTGGDNQGVFAATYQVQGPIDKPKVTVNPVAVLAPGFLRNILFMDKSLNKMEEEKKPASGEAGVGRRP